MSEDTFLLCVFVALVTCALTYWFAAENFRYKAVQAGKAEYYLDGKNVEWRWKP